MVNHVDVMVDNSTAAPESMERWCQNQPLVGNGSSPRRTEHFAFNLMDKVIIREIHRPGVIDSLIIDSLGRQYRVVFWNDGSRNAHWLYEWELELR